MMTENYRFVEQVRSAPPSWANDEILRWDDSCFRRERDFITRHYWTTQGSINVFRIIGTDHPQYAGMSWLELLDRGKRMDINIPLLEKNPGYYTEPGHKRSSMNFNSFDGINWFIGSDGNHRSCLARFYFHVNGLGMTQLHDVTMNHYDIDHLYYEACREIQKLIDVMAQQGIYLTLEVRNQVVHRDDTPGWKLDHFQIEAQLHQNGEHNFPELDAVSYMQNAQDARTCLSVLKQRYEQCQSSQQIKAGSTGTSWMRWLRLGKSHERK
jgi:hypothetical protein